MKLLLFFLAVNVLLCNISSFALKRKTLKSKAVITCPTNDVEKAKSKTYPTNFKKASTVPDDVTAYAALLAKSKKQTTAARKLFYHPNDVAKAELKKAAASMEQLISFMDPGKTFEQGWIQVLNKKFNRQVLGGSGQIPDQKATRLSILDIVGRIKNGNGTGKDIAAFMALMGDVGTAVGDLGSGKSTATKDKNEFDAFTVVMLRFKDCCFPAVKHKAQTLLAIANGIYQERSGDAQTGGCKKPQRGDYLLQGTKKTGNRGGVFETNMSHEIDDALGVKEGDRIPLVSWPWQTVNDEIINTCPAEPWAGHYSGSVVEIMMTFDFFNYVSSNDEHEAHPLASYDFVLPKDNDPLKAFNFPAKPTYTSLNSAKRQARAALASAYLISNGMHSALEVAFSVKLYLGKIKPSSDRKAKCDNSATDDISKLMADSTAA